VNIDRFIGTYGCVYPDVADLHRRAAQVRLQVNQNMCGYH